MKKDTLLPVDKKLSSILALQLRKQRIPKSGKRFLVARKMDVINGKLVLQSTRVPILAEAPLTASRQKKRAARSLPLYIVRPMHGLLAYMHEGGRPA